MLATGTGMIARLHSTSTPTGGPLRAGGHGNVTVTEAALRVSQVPCRFRWHGHGRRESGCDGGESDATSSTRPRPPVQVPAQLLRAAAIRC